MAFTSRVVGIARAAVTAVGRAVDAVIRALTAAWATAWDALTGRFTAAIEQLLTGEETWPSRRAIEHDPALQDALTDAARALEMLAALTAAETSRAARAATTAAADDQRQVIDAQLPPGRATSERPGGFHARAIATITARAQQRITVLTRPLGADADRAMRRTLVRGVRVGANPRDTAARMVRQVEGQFNGGLTRALTIARTETLDAYRQAAAAVQDASRDVLEGWVWLAQLDGRGCPACWAMHGTVHPLDEPGPLGHPNCRCSRAPKTQSWRDLGFDMDEPEDQIPDAEQVFQALPRAVQVRIMGPARLGLLDRGEVSWPDLARRKDNPGWRPSWMPVPVQDLAATG